MKPNFALYFTEDSLGLLHRTPHGWMEVGATPLDTPDLGEAMSYLRGSALGLEPHGVATKLVIPNSQVLYLSVTAPGPTDDDRDSQIRIALEGRTPYAVDELLFDWSGDGPEVQVAVVARETVQEAEDFAASFRLNPVSCVAVPDPQAFAGEPWFGPTETAAALLEDGDMVERDDAPVVVISRAEAMLAAPAADLTAAEEEEADPGLPPPADPSPAAPAPELPEPEPEQPADLPEPELPEPEQPEPELPEPELPPAAPQELPELPPETEPGAPELPQPAEPELPEELPSELPEIEAPERDDHLFEEPELDEPAFEEPTFGEPAFDAPEFEADDAPLPMASAPVMADFDAPAEAPADDFMRNGSGVSTSFATEDDDAPAPPPAAIRPAGPEVIPPVGVAASLAGTFASRRGLAADAVPPAAAAPMAAPVAPPAPILPPRKAPPAPLTPPRLSASAAAPRGYDPSTDTDNDPYEDEVFAFPGAEDDEDDVPPSPAPAIIAARDAARLPPPMPSALARRAAQLAATPRPEAKPAAAKPAAKPGKPAQVSAPTLPGFGSRKVKPATPAPVAPPPMTAPPMTAPPVTAAPVTIPPVTPAPPRPAPAMATAASAQIPTPAAAAETLVAPPPAATPGFQPKARPISRGKPKYLGLALTVILLLILAAIAAWSSFYLTRGDDTPAQPEVAGQALPTGEAPAGAAPSPEPPSPEDEAAADGIAPEDVTVAATAPETEAAPPAADLPPEADAATGEAPALPPAAQDPIILSSMDSAPSSGAVLPLQAPQTGADTMPLAAPVPPPFGTSYEFDAAGLIKPTAAGIVTPDGYRLIAGAPPVVPPPRPAALAPAPAAATTPEAATAPPATDPALEAARPQPRPADLAPPAPGDGAAAATPVENPLAGYRPKARPESVIAAAEQRRLDDEARRVAEAASISAAAAAQALAAAAPEAEAGPVPGGIGISRQPPQRPRNFNRAVEAAVAAAAAATLAPPPAPAAVAPAAAPAPAPQEEPAPEPKRAARTAVPGEDEEPEVAAAAKAPKIPTAASVAKNATYVNAIDLRKTNLIGVYGTPAKRYALIRTSGGQYRKVRVGDRLDGGTVAAITEGELRYKKGSRMLALALPKG